MSQETERHEIARKSVVYCIPGSDAVTVQPDVKYHGTDSNALTMDIYFPGESHRRAPIPAMVFVLGYSDVGVQKAVGCKAKEMASSISWARLTAASGMAAITYTNREPIADLDALLEFLRDNASSLGVDAGRICIWAASGNVPLALSLLMETGKPPEHPQCAVLCYGLM